VAGAVEDKQLAGIAGGARGSVVVAAEGDRDGLIGAAVGDQRRQSQREPRGRRGIGRGGTA
jgi:hypothetical protein